MAKQFDYQAILETYRSLQDQANKANEDRYQGILSQDAFNQERVGASYGQAFDLIENLGQGESERIDIRGVRDFAAADQDLTSRGLGNTTIRESVRRGVGEDVDRSKRELTEQVGRQKSGVVQARAGAEERMGNFLTNMMERKTEQGPDLSRLSALLSQAGAGQGTQDAASDTIFTGLSANARAGLDVFGGSSGGGGLLPASGRTGNIRASANSGKPGDPSFGLRGGTGSQNAPAQIIGSRGQNLPVGNGAVFRQAASGALTGVGGGQQGGAPNPNDAGVGGSSFDNLFTGGNVFSQGDQIGSYGGGGQINLAGDMDLLGQGGEIDSNRIPQSQGGDAQTTPQPSGGGGGLQSFTVEAGINAGVGIGKRKVVQAANSADALGVAGWGWRIVG